MEILIPVAVIGGVIVFIGAIFYVSHLVEKKRTEALKSIAESLGLPFFPKGDLTLVSTLGSFHLFKQGRSRTITNMIHGDTEDVDMAIFDYRYVTGSGKNQHTWNQTVAYIESQHLTLPDFAARPEGLFHKLGKIVGLKDINFESHPQFSDRFWLQGSNEEAIRKLFRPEVLQWFVSKESRSAEGMGTRLIIYRSGKRTSPADIRQLMQDAFELHGLLRGPE